VIRTRVGYSGGTAKNPTYRNLGDHAETVQIDYDPARVSYAQLLDVFWKSHLPTSPRWSRQYMSAIFYHNEEQKKLALKTRDSEAAGRNGKIFTEIVPFSTFYIAEDYHQKYRLRQEADLMREFRAMYPDEKGFVSSTAAARINGYLDGYGTSDMLRAELHRFGLSPEASRRLLDIVARSFSSRGCPL
jgi:peptide-methionine (S)-S-oxide reductase